MPNYYTLVTEDIAPGHLAYSDDINLIQNGIQASESQLISDNFGEGYVLDDNQDAFLMSPVGPGDEQIDQMNRPVQFLAWQSMNDLYVRQTVAIEKSSVESITVYVKNTSGQPRVLRGEFRTVETEEVDSELISTYEVTIPASQTAGAPAEFSFNVHHLARNNYYLVIKYAPGIQIAIDTAGDYNKSFATSINGVQYSQVPKDLWFEERYATSLTYNIEQGMAVIHGEKTQNLDTHVKIAERSLYGDRIDIVVMNKEGEFEVIQGDVSATGKPVAPEDSIPYGRLKIAYVTVPQDPYKNILLDQNDSLGKSRIRSHNERLRRLEKKTDWIFTYNAPERVKYNLTGSTFFDSANSQNVEPILAGSQTIGYRLASHAVNDYYWSFKDFSGNPPFEGEYENDNGISSFSEIDHTDHSSGILKLQKRTATDVIYTSYKEKDQRTYTGNRKVLTYMNNKYQSEYPGNTFALTTPTRLKQINVDARFYRNAASVRLDLYRAGGAKIASSDTKNLRGYPSGAYNIINTEVFGFNFGEISLEPGTYYWVLIIEPKYWNQPAESWINTISYPGMWGELLIFQGRWPSNPSGMGLKYRLGETMIFDIIAVKDVLAGEGQIVSSMIDTTDGVGSIAVDMNLNLPKNTLYELYVTNDNGTTWQRMQGKYLNFPNTGHQFIWKLTLKTNDGSSTPILSYSSVKQYAIKFSLGLTGGTPEITGSLVTLPICGPTVLQEALPVATGIDKFSHWEWLRMWCMENAGTIEIDIEATDDPSTTWTNIKSGLTPDELYHGSVDYSNYEGSYEEDEYNYHCDLDEEIILQDTVIIDRCEDEWAETPDDSQLTHSVDSSIYQEGTKSAKVSFTSYTGATGQELVFMSKAVNLDLSRYDSIKFQIRTDKSGGLIANEAQFCLGTSEKCATGEFHNIPAVAAGSFSEITIPLEDPDALTRVISLGLKRSASGSAWNGVSIWIDNVVGIISNRRTIDECETGFTSAQSSNVTVTQNSDHQSGTYSTQIAIGAGATTGLLVKKALNEDLSDFNQVRIFIKPITTTINSKDLELVFGSNATCTSIIGAYYLPGLDPDAWTQVTIDLENAEDYEAVKSIGIRMAVDKQLTFRIDKIEGLKTTKYPFYQKCVRFRFNLSRNQGTDLSPVVRKIGVIPQVI